MTASNCRRPFAASCFASSIGSEVIEGGVATLLRSPGSSPLVTFCALQGLGRLINDFPRNAVIFDLGVAICEAPALLFLLAERHFHRPRSLDQNRQFLGHC